MKGVSPVAVPPRGTPMLMGFTGPPPDEPMVEPPKKSSPVLKKFTPMARTPLRLTSARRTCTSTCCTPGMRELSTKGISYISR